MSQSWKATLLELMIAFAWFVILASALTSWPMVMHPTEVIVGGGELEDGFGVSGGTSEVKALEQEDFGLWGTIESLIGLGRFPETGNILDILLLTFPLREWLGVGLDHNARLSLSCLETVCAGMYLLDVSQILGWYLWLLGQWLL